MGEQAFDHRDEHGADAVNATPSRAWRTPRLLVAEVASVTEKASLTVETTFAGPS